jgi:hypothetical protein
LAGKLGFYKKTFFIAEDRTKTSNSAPSKIVGFLAAPVTQPYVNNLIPIFLRVKKFACMGCV